MRHLITILIFVISGISLAQDSTKVNWMTWDQMMVARSLKPKKVFVYFEVDYEPECAKMDSTTLIDPSVVWYLNNEFYAVRMNAQSRDTIVYLRRALIYREYSGEKGEGYHDLAAGLLNHKFDFPSIVFLKEDMNRIQVIPGYINPRLCSGYLDFVSVDGYLKKNVMSFGDVTYQCNNPNHPHNRLKAQEQLRKEREGSRKGE